MEVVLGCAHMVLLRDSNGEAVYHIAEAPEGKAVELHFRDAQSIGSIFPNGPPPHITVTIGYPPVPGAKGSA